MTEAAEHFMTAVTLQALSGQPVATSQWDTREPNNMPHINLGREADAIVLAPASADFIARLVQGRADELLSLTCLARPRERCPLLVAPAMNREMWSHPATQRNVAQLVADGALILGPGSGDQACGEVGDGRMLEPAELLEDLIAFFQPKLLAGRRVLEVACGTGYWTPGIAAQAHSVVATDANAEPMAFARLRPGADNVDFRLADVYALPQDLGHFDGAFAGLWFSHVPVEARRDFLAGLRSEVFDRSCGLSLDDRNKLLKRTINSVGFGARASNASWFVGDEWHSGALKKLYKDEPAAFVNLQRSSIFKNFIQEQDLLDELANPAGATLLTSDGNEASSRLKAVKNTTVPSTRARRLLPNHQKNSSQSSSTLTAPSSTCFMRRFFSP